MIFSPRFISKALPAITVYNCIRLTRWLLQLCKAMAHITEKGLPRLPDLAPTNAAPAAVKSALKTFFNSPWAKFGEQMFDLSELKDLCEDFKEQHETALKAAAKFKATLIEAGDKFFFKGSWTLKDHAEFLTNPALHLVAHALNDIVNNLRPPPPPAPLATPGAGAVATADSLGATGAAPAPPNGTGVTAGSAAAPSVASGGNGHANVGGDSAGAAPTPGGAPAQAADKGLATEVINSSISVCVASPVASCLARFLYLTFVQDL